MLDRGDALKALIRAQAVWTPAGIGKVTGIGERMLGVSYYKTTHPLKETTRIQSGRAWLPEEIRVAGAAEFKLFYGFPVAADAPTTETLYERLTKIVRSAR